MLRWAIALLLLANAGYFAWSQGYLGPLGLTAQPQREPERLHTQLRPEALRLLNGPALDATRQTDPGAPAAATPNVAPLADPAQTDAPAPSAAGACWLASGFSAAQADALRAALALLDLPSASWQLTPTGSGGRWIVYMGRFDNPQQLERKQAELRALQVEFRSVNTAGLRPGLALGTFSSEAAAQQALRDLRPQGVRTARVVLYRTETLSYTLRLPQASAAQHAAVAALGPALAGRTLQRCE